MTTLLNQSLSNRQNKIQTAKDYLMRTKELFDEFGSAELKTSHARFNELLDALNADSIRLVVLGEFSRGKSSLVNALLGIDLLPTAMQATTAINTFIRALPSDRSERFIRIHYQDGRPAEEVKWTDDAALERWGTELDQGHADIRKSLDYIEAFMDHPLLQNGMVLIDTPGLESVMKHHELITRKAIAEAHIALWLQNTAMLGGSISEWNFLSETIRNNFRKFITVIGWWDKVMEPDDAREKRMSLEERENEKLAVVKQNFSKFIDDAAEVDVLTNAKHLIPVSAFWALSDDPVKQQKSGIDRLSQRIAEMFSSNEALDQIYIKPLQQLSHIQRQLEGTLIDELQQLESDKTLEERKHELQKLELDIRDLEQEEIRETAESREEHERVVLNLTEKIISDMSRPLQRLKDSIEDQVTESYIRKMIASKAKQIGLPEELEQQLETITKQVNVAWQNQKKEMAKVLEGLRSQYLQKMEKHAKNIEGGLDALNISLPDFDINLDFDLSGLEEHYQNISRIKEAMERAESEIHEFESEIASTVFDEKKRLKAEADVARYARQLENMGPPPAPIVRSERRKVSDWGSGFLWLGATYNTVDVVDWSNVEDFKAEKQELADRLESKDALLQKVLEEEFRLTGRRMNIEQAKKKVEKLHAKLEKEANAIARNAEKAQEALIAESLKKLSRNTIARLTETIEFLEKHVTNAVRSVFMEQANLLAACVQENLFEPLNAKRVQQEQVNHLLQQGQTEIAARKTKLITAQQGLAEVQKFTQAALNNYGQ